MNIGSQHVLRIFPGILSPTVQSTAVSVGEFVTSQEAIQVVLSKLEICECSENFELVEVCYRNSVLEHESEKVLKDADFPIQLIKSWDYLTPAARSCYRIFIREKRAADSEELSPRLRQNWMDCHENIKTMNHNFSLDLDFRLPDDDLCQLPKLDKDMLLKHLQERFEAGRIYTYVGEILLAVNPFKFFPIYNPKFITTYNNKNLGSLPPHIFAIADISFHRMLKEKKSQCIVISGESGSGKTESTKLIVHHLTALSRKSQATTAIEKTVLGVGPVLEAFGNAKTAYNNNSSRFGKFTQIKFREDGAVTGNYHVFYYLLAGAPSEFREELHLTHPKDYYYLNQSKCYSIDGIDEAYEFLRLKQSMDMVGFTIDIQQRIFRALASVLNIGNIRFKRKPGNEDEVLVENNKEVKIVSELLMSSSSDVLSHVLRNDAITVSKIQVTEEKLLEVITTRKQITRGEQFIVPYKYHEALAARDGMAKALYGTLFDWIVLQVNHVLVIKQQSPREWCSIGVLDIFGFEDFAHNSFEQLCINYANEKLQYYFNQHIFRLEQDEYNAEGIEWRNVEFVDNYACIELISGRPTGLMHLIDEESRFPRATEITLLEKMNKTHCSNNYYDPSLMGPSFTVKHYAGSVKYKIEGFLDKNRDLMRPDILSVLKSSNLRFIRELLGADPMAVYRWSIVRAFFKAVHAFTVAGRKFRMSDKANERSNSRKRRVNRCLNLELSILNSDEDQSKPLFKKASKVIRRMQSQNTKIAPSKNFVHKIRHGLETKRDMSIRTYDYLYKTQRGKATPMNPPTVSAQFQVSSVWRLCQAYFASWLACYSDVIVNDDDDGVNDDGDDDDGDDAVDDGDDDDGVDDVDDVDDSTDGVNDDDGVNDGDDDDDGVDDDDGDDAVDDGDDAVDDGDDDGVDDVDDSTDGVNDDDGVDDGVDDDDDDDDDAVDDGDDAVDDGDDAVDAVDDGDDDDGVDDVDDSTDGVNDDDGVDTTSSLNRLMEILGEAQPFFVRCIRSNAEKAPLKFDCDVVQRQLRYTGMLETVRIRRLGYQWRFHLEEFVKRYSLLFPRAINDAKKQICGVLKSLKLDPNEYQIGSSKIFLRESQHRILQDQLHQVFISKICTIQRWTRGVLQRKHFLRQKSAAITIQAHVRGYLARNEIANQSYAATRVQATWRRYHAQNSYMRTRHRIILLQAGIRGWLARKRYEELLKRRREEEEEKRRSRIAEVQLRSRLDDFQSRRLVRSISDPTDYDKPQKTTFEDIEEKPEVTSETPAEVKVISSEENLPSENAASRVKELSKRFERDLVLLSPADVRGTTPRLLRSSCTAALRKLPRSMPIEMETHATAEEEDKPATPDIVKLNAVFSPTELMAFKTATPEVTCTVLPRRMTSSIRRRLSSKSRSKSGLRMSTSDIPDEPPFRYSVDDSFILGARPGSIETLPSMSSLASSSGDVRKSKGRSLFRRRNRNSIRRKSEPGLAKHGIKKPEKSEIKPSRSTEGERADLRIGDWGGDLINAAMKQTKIVSTISKSVITGTKQVKPTSKKVARGAADLSALESFLMSKISLLNQEDNIRDTIVDRVFRKALHEFHGYLISERSLIINHGKSVSLTYEHMVTKFETILQKTIRMERIGVTFPAVMGVNAFSGVLDEYFSTRAQALAKAEKSRAPKQNAKRKLKRKSDLQHYNNHKFGVAQFSIPTFCEHCNALIWVLEKGMVCQDCRFTCHKKCYLKSTLLCVWNTNKSKSYSKRQSVFGGELIDMTTEDSSIPDVVEKLIQDIEFRGLYAEGLYRKSPNAATVRALKNTIISNGIGSVDLTAYSVHVVAAVLKLFFRQLGSPVFTNEGYYEVIRTAELSDERVKLETLFSIVQKLPRVNAEIFERLIFHLARVAENEQSNLMHPNALSIIWAPCIMRTPENLGPMESLQHVPKQTQFLETLITNQVKKIRSTLSDIRVLDKAADSTNKRLSMLNLRDEEQELVEQDLVSEGDEVDVLTANLTMLKPGRHKEGDSGEDLASDENITDDELDLDILDNEDYAVTFDLPAAPAVLNHLTKHRAKLQSNKRLPTRSKLRDSTIQEYHV
ncbi:hypothetical protein QZH41_017546 [Actinostola sp. cb2023]|nr:hypothetical protein QZH41_017546 [Actinostola sp. cb2023]